MIRPYLRDNKASMKLRVCLGNEIIDYETQLGEWKIQCKSILFLLKTLKKFVLWAQRAIIEIMIGSETDDIIKELCESLLQGYQDELEEKMNGSRFVRGSIDLLHYHLHKTSLIRGGSYIDTPEWLKNKRATIYPKNIKDDKCFQYVLTAELNYQ